MLPVGTPFCGPKGKGMVRSVEKKTIKGKEKKEGSGKWGERTVKKIGASLKKQTPCRYQREEKYHERRVRDFPLARGKKRGEKGDWALRKAERSS